MKKRILAVLILFVLCGTALCQEIEYVVTEDSNLTRNYSTTATVKKGDAVFFQGIIGGRETSAGSNEYSISVRNAQGQEGWISSKHILLRDNRPLPSQITGKIWIPDYYQRFIAGSPKEALFDHEPLWRDEFDKVWDPMNGSEWSWFAGSMRFAIIDSFVLVSGIFVNDSIYFATISQKYDNGTVTLHVLCTWKSNVLPQSPLNIRFSEGETYRLTFRIDGDYMDFFIDDDEEATATLVGVDGYFREAVREFFQHGTKADLSRIIWPRRADGSTDFPPPEGVNLAFRADHKTIDRLRVRENPDTGSAIVTTLDTGMQVQVLETGATETIGGISAPWVKVLAENGFTGWAFSGYLETQSPETQNQESTNQEPENVEAQNLDSENLKPENVETQNLDSANLENPKSGFPVLPFAITGGVILVAGIVTTAVMAKP